MFWRFHGLAAVGLAAGILAASTIGSAADKTAPADAPAAKLIEAAIGQINVTLIYDSSYRRLAYPMGDPPRRYGVCTDVVIRAYRDALGIDLQRRVHEDMRRAFAKYPRIWGLKRPDSNIDHRRVPNLRVFFARHGTRLPVTGDPQDYRPGDIVTQLVSGKLPHIGIVSDRVSADGKRPLVIHNIGLGARLEDILFEFPITGHYRYEL